MFLDTRTNWFLKYDWKHLILFLPVILLVMQCWHQVLAQVFLLQNHLLNNLLFFHEKPTPSSILLRFIDLMCVPKAFCSSFPTCWSDGSIYRTEPNIIKKFQFQSGPLLEGYPVEDMCSFPHTFWEFISLSLDYLIN